MKKGERKDWSREQDICTRRRYNLRKNLILKMASQKRLKKEDWRKEAAGYIGETGL